MHEKIPTILNIYPEKLVFRNYLPAALAQGKKLMHSGMARQISKEPKLKLILKYVFFLMVFSCFHFISEILLFLVVLSRTHKGGAKTVGVGAVLRCGSEYTEMIRLIAQAPASQQDGKLLRSPPSLGEYP
jgi:hypothetical protein